MTYNYLRQLHTRKVWGIDAAAVFIPNMIGTYDLYCKYAMTYN
jgi:hypothetical protein